MEAIKTGMIYRQAEIGEVGEDRQAPGGVRQKRGDRQAGLATGGLVHKEH